MTCFLVFETFAFLFLFRGYVPFLKLSETYEPTGRLKFNHRLIEWPLPCYILPPPALGCSMEYRIITKRATVCGLYSGVLRKSEDNWGDKKTGQQNNSKPLAPAGTANIKYRSTSITSFVRFQQKLKGMLSVKRKVVVWRKKVKFRSRLRYTIEVGGFR